MHFQVAARDTVEAQGCRRPTDTGCNGLSGIKGWNGTRARGVLEVRGGGT